MGAKSFDDFNRQLEDDRSLSTPDYVEIHEDFQSSLKVYGESLKRTVLSLAKEGSFEAAKRELRFYQDMNKNTPGFENRTKHYFIHCYELLDAINNLKHVPNFEHLRAAQQKQIRERIMTYAQDLSSILGRIDKVTNDLKIQDIKSTLWVFKAIVMCSSTIIFVAALIEGLKHIGSPITTVAHLILNWFIFIFEH